MKHALRRKALEARKGIDAATAARLSEKAQALLISLPEFKQAGTVLLYAATSDEVQTNFIIAAALAQGKRVVLPAVVGKRMEARLCGSAAELKPGVFGILEPAGGVVAPGEIDLAVVPGVAFDLAGNRLGRGGAYYDSFLRHLACPKVGLAFEVQVVDAVPAEAHDVRVDKLVTEKRVVDCSR